MAGYCTPKHTLEFIPSRALDASGSPESSTAVLNEEIDTLANEEIRSAPLGYALPASEPDPLTILWLILEGLNCIQIAADQIATYAPTVDVEISKYASALEKLGEERLIFWRTQKFLPALKFNDIPADPLCDIEDCTIATPGFTPVSGEATVTPAYTPDPEDLPYRQTIERWILRETAVVRVFARAGGLKQSSLNSNQASTYRGLVSGTVRAFVLAARSFIQKDYDSTIDAHVAHLLAAARKKQALLLTNHYDHILKA